MHARITEVVLRDGLQDEPVLVSTGHRRLLLDALLTTGLTEFEVASFVSGERVPQMADAEGLLGALPRPPGVRLCGLVLNRRGALRAIGTGLHEIRLAVSASPAHSAANAGRTTEEALDEIAAAVEALTEKEPQAHLVGAVATAFVCPELGPLPADRLLRVVRSLHGLGLRHISLADTLGTATAGHVSRSVGAVRDAFPDLEIGLHLHDAGGRALLSVDAALDLGVRRFDSSLAGLGGCPFASGGHGNLATESLVRHLHERGVGTGVDEAELPAAAAVLRAVLDASPTLSIPTSQGRR